MSGNVRANWAWTEQRERAALLVAQDRLSDREIAEALDITERTINRWRAVPEFRARVEEHVKAAREAIRTEGIADLLNRVARKNADWLALQRIKAARAANPDNHRFDGGDTGLIVVRLKAVGTGQSQMIVEEAAIDTSLLAELDRLEEGVAKELGQRVERHEIEQRDMGAAASLDEKIAQLAERLAADAPPPVQAGSA